jgi:hypothetical protein
VHVCEQHNAIFSAVHCYYLSSSLRARAAVAVKGSRNVCVAGWLQLEKQLAAAERCAAELKDLSTSLTGVRQEDMEMLKVSI